jgi:hypothetical protein
MNGSMTALAVEALVVVLLLFTIGYCYILNGRLKRLRSDEQALRATISELVTATEIAERAVKALKTAVGEADKALGRRMTDAEAVRQELGRLVESAERLRPGQSVPHVAASDPVVAPMASAPRAPRMASRPSRPAFAGLATR